MLRMLRLLKLDKYVPCLTLIDDVLRDKAHTLVVTGFAAGVFWIFVAMLLHLAEKDDQVCTNLGDGDPTKGDAVQCVGPTQAQRFQDVPHALPYSLILLTGDYPLVDFTFWGKIINFFMVLFAAGVCAVPSGVIAAGFTDLLRQRRRENRRGDPEKPAYSNSWFKAIGLEWLVNCSPPEGVSSEIERWQLRVHEVLTGEGEGEGTISKVVRSSIVSLILLNVLAVILESEPEIGGGNGSLGELPFDIIEGISVGLFTVEFCARLFAARYEVSAGFSYVGYLLSFYGIVDVISILPYFIGVAMGLDNNTVFRVFRLCRLFQLEHFMEAFTLIDDVFMGCADILAATGLLALIIWLGAATLFYTFEKDNAAVGDDFDNIPNALYFTAVFLGGEWAVCDFTPAGKFVSMFLCIIGIALYAIPVGTIFESFGDVLAERAEADKAAAELPQQALADTEEQTTP